MVFCVVCQSILTSILSKFFSKFIVTLPSASKTTLVTSIFLRFQSLCISFEILILFNLLLFLVNYSLAPRYSHIYNYCCLCYYHVTYEFQSESTLYSFLECQGTPCWKQAPYHKFKGQQQDSNTL